MAGEDVNCPMCGRNSVLVYRDLRDQQYDAVPLATYYRCSERNCGHLFSHPMAREDEILSLYASYSTHADTPLFPTGIRARVYHFIAVTFGLPDRLGDQINRWRLMDMQGRSGSVLDVGCGSGNLLKALQEKIPGRKVGIDFDPKAVEAAKSNGIDARLATIEEVDDGPYDNLLLNHVIEHIPDPDAFLKTARDKIRPGGVLIIRTPNSGSILSRRFGEDWRGLEPPRHLHIFTVPSLRALAQRTGFEIDEVSSSNAMLTAIYFASAKIRGDRTKGWKKASQWMSAKLKFPVVILRSSLARLRDQECGEEVVAVLRRP